MRRLPTIFRSSFSVPRVTQGAKSQPRQHLQRVSNWPSAPWLHLCEKHLYSCPSFSMFLFFHFSPCPSKSAEDRLIHFSEHWTFQDRVYPVNEIFWSHPKGDLQTLLSHRQLGSVLTQWQPEPKRATRGPGGTAAVPEADPWVHDWLTEVMKTLKVKSVTYEEVQVVQQGWDENWKAFHERLIEAFKKYSRRFSGGSLGKNPLANAGHMGSIPDPGRSYVSWSS